MAPIAYLFHFLYYVSAFCYASPLENYQFDSNLLDNEQLQGIGPCISEDGFELIMGRTLPQCLEECERRTLCKAINYNRFNTACFLRENHNVMLTEKYVDMNRWKCYNILSLNNSSIFLKGHCAKKFCNSTSVCLDMLLGASRCQLAYCLSVTNISNASFIRSLVTKVGRNNTLYCNEGFAGFGQASITCQLNGIFSETDFRCLKTCPKLPSKITAVTSSISTYTFVKNTTGMYKCMEGFYNLSLPRSVCNKTGDWSDDTSGNWSDPTVECYKYCAQPTPPYANVEVNGTAPYIFGHTMTFTCHPGYYLSTDISTAVATCKPDGTWTYSADCYKYCGEPPGIADGVSTSVSRSAPYTVGTQAFYGCNIFYHLSVCGNRIKTCNQDGVWAGLVACCGVCKTYNGGSCVSQDGCFERC